MLQITGIEVPVRKELIQDVNCLSVGGLVSLLLTYSIIAAGLFFFVRLLSAGYTYMTSGGDSGKLQNATKEISNAVIGLLIVISAYFIAQIIYVIFGINLLNTTTGCTNE